MFDSLVGAAVLDMLPCGVCGWKRFNQESRGVRVVLVGGLEACVCAWGCKTAAGGGAEGGVVGLAMRRAPGGGSSRLEPQSEDQGVVRSTGSAVPKEVPAIAAIAALSRFAWLASQSAAASSRSTSATP